MSRPNAIIEIVQADGSKEKYELRVCAVISRHEDGTPNQLELILNNQKVDVTQKKEFMTVWCPLRMMGNEGTG